MPDVEDLVSDSAPTDVPIPVPVDSPPPAPQMVRAAPPDPRLRLHAIAAELTRSHNRRLLVEFLQLRRALL